MAQFELAVEKGSFCTFLNILKALCIIAINYSFKIPFDSFINQLCYKVVLTIIIEGTESTNLLWPKNGIRITTINGFNPSLDLFKHNWAKKISSDFDFCLNCISICLD